MLDALDAAELEHEFKRALLASDQDDAVTSIVCATEWIRMFFTRGSDESHPILEIELAPPCESNSSQELVRVRLQELQDHLEYLLRLGDNGFALRSSWEDCLWSASLMIPRDSDMAFFQLILPPRTSNMERRR